MTEEEIMSTWQKEYNNQPVLTIWCMVYNHEKFIEQCLDSFLMQKTTYPFVVVPHDDASTDSSALILQKYPHIIKPVLEKKCIFTRKLSIRRIRKKMF
ncbi:MAG: glycosyltransferase family A protein [Lachnospiraceae bacterium]|nr:glycosyltransferase family A protein [Lachnospiraceae bacterium]